MPIYQRQVKGSISLFVKGQLKGVSYWETIPSGKRTAARLREAEIRKEILERKYKRASESRTFKDFLVRDYFPWAKKHLRGVRKISTTLIVLQEYFGEMALGDITPKHIRRFVARRSETPTVHGKPRAAASVQREMAVLSSILSLAVEDEQIQANPCFRVKRPPVHPRKISYLSYEDEANLLQHCVDERAHLRDIIVLGINTGMRPGPTELLGIQRRHIDFANNRIVFEQHKTDKTGRLRIIPLNSVAREILLRLAIQRAENDYLFLHPYTGQRLLSIKKSFKRAAALAGLPKEKSFPYVLRHTFGSRLAEAGVPVTEIKELLGHANLTITMRYLHTTEEATQAAIEKIVRKGAA